MAAVGCGLVSIQPQQEPTFALTVAARDLAAGTEVSSHDLTEVRVPRDAAPSALVSDPTGKRLLSPVRAGEPITEARIVDTGLSAGYPGRVVVPVRLTDPDVAALLAVGDKVDLLSIDPETGAALLVGRDALVVRLPRDRGGSASLPGAVIVLALDSGAVSDTMEASVRKYLTIQWSS